MTTRRLFIRGLPLVGTTFLAAPALRAQDAPMVGEKDPQAVGLGYVADATKTDKAKFAKYAAGQECGNCQLFQGKPTDAAGGCAIFAGKKVATKGWCNAYVKKA